MPWKTLWWVAAALTAAATFVLAGIRVTAYLPNLGPWPTALLIATIGVSPLVIAATARSEPRRWAGLLLLVAGLVLVLVGAVEAARDGFLSLRLVSGDWRLIARGTSATAPLGLIVVGLCWVGAAAGARRRRRAWLRASVGVLGLTAWWFTASFAASSVWRVRQGEPLQVDTGGVVIAALLAVAGGLALAVPRVVDATPAAAVVKPDGVAPVWSDPAPPRHARLIGAGLIIVLLIGGSLALWTHDVDRLVLAQEFEDPALAACVATAVGVDGVDARVSAADLADVLALTCTGPEGGGATAAISDLTGIAALTNLSTLDLTGNAVSDLAPLAGLDLWGLVITGNPVTDLTPLAGMSMLTNLGASGTQVTDLGPLAGLTTLAYLGLRGTGLADLGPLGALPNLNELDVSENAVTDVGPLAGLQYLTSLEITGNAVTDLGPLGPLPQLWTLDAARNQIGDLSTIPQMPALSELWLGENPLVDVAPLTSLPALTGVDLTGLPSDLPGISELRAAGVYVGGLA